MSAVNTHSFSFQHAFFWLLTFVVCIVSVYLVISAVYLVVFTAYIVIVSFTNCYIHIFSSSAASVFNKFTSLYILC